MREDTLTAIIGIAIGAAIIGGVLFLATLVLDASCTAKWPAALKPQYQLIAGCTVEANGLRVPDTAYRVL